ncbi:LysR family transcriptional regulator [Vibrio sp. SCSIO 43136]|uniref:LysR family transcriptional regulator n=1 Tax=Vibrio sp. SCSIO 43136 TaxID=2819101 RepID=UPI002075AD3A|nr:LysR family transcriptional regulator [Vibrio sp. SCSIO 43136]USD67998.1 LysR family transcriptional regulator [Vibrio sp. SCSIO 43136]
MNKANFTLDQLTAFVNTVEQGSFKNAAISLGKHATTVSQQVAMLEVDVGFDLFERKVRRIILTPQGEEFYRYAKPVLREAALLGNKLEALDSNLPIDFKLAIDSTIRDRQIIRCAKDVCEKYPTIKLEIMSGDPIQVIDWVRENQADVGVITTLFNQLPQLDTKQLFNFQLAYVCSPRWEHSLGTITENELRAFPQIVYRFVEQSPQLSGHIISNHTLSVHSLDDMIDLLSLNMGWAILPRFRVEDLIDSGELVEFKPDQSSNVNWYTELLLKSDSKTNPVLDTFINSVTKLSDR